ncbi:MAG: SLOG cluster 4 domain-containing protein [Minisyncoccota bacterium]
MDNDKHQHFKIKICVSGAADTTHCGEGALERGKELGREIVRQGGILVTGATTGFPLWAAMGAKEAGGISIGLSPASSEKEHVEVYKLPLDYLDIIIYTGFGYSGRNLLLTRSSDAIIVGCGRIGTVNEFTVAFEDHKPIGVLRGPWETDEVFDFMLEKSHRRDEGSVLFEEDPKNLVAKLIDTVQGTKTCDLGEKCPAYVYENYDAVGGKEGDRIL